LTPAPARGLYLATRVLAVVGVALAAAGVAAPIPSGGARFLLIAGIGVLTCAFVAAAAHQAAMRAGRPAEAYRGPSPVVVLVAATGITSVAVAAAGALALIDLSSTSGVFASLLASAIAYAGLVWALVVRTGVLGWAEMGWPVRGPGSAARYARDAAAAIGIVVPTYLASAFLGGMLALALGVRLESPLPAPSSTGELLLTILGAALVAPIGEELFFRGFALTAWWRDLGAPAALARSTIFFAVVHVLNVSSASADEFLRLALLQFAVILPVGYVLGWLFIRRGMVAAVAGHMSFNGIALVLFVAASAAG
jgi:membrane protease YdiL (CAAX protease family)